MAEHNDFGRKGEILAKKYLETLSYEVLEENWVHGRSEVDLVAYKNKTIIFVEVKTRSGNQFGEPEDFVDLKKQKQMEKAASQYISLMDFEGEIRFDIIAILFDKEKNYKLRHIEDAFWPDPN